MNDIGKKIKQTPAGEVIVEITSRPSDEEMNRQLAEATRADQEAIERLKDANPNIFPATQQKPEPEPEETAVKTTGEAPADIAWQLMQKNREDFELAEQRKKQIGETLRPKF